MNFLDLSIGLHLAITFGIVLAIALAIGAIGKVMKITTDGIFKELAEKYISKTDLLYKTIVSRANLERITPLVASADMSIQAHDIERIAANSSGIAKTL